MKRVTIRNYLVAAAAVALALGCGGLRPRCG